MWCTTFSWNFCKENRLSCTRNRNLCSPGYLWQGEINVCKVLALFKLVPVKNDYFLHRKFELHRYQLMNGFLLYWHRFYWRKYGEYFSHELIFRLIPTRIWYDLLTVSQIWSPDLTIWLANRQLSYFF